MHQCILANKLIHKLYSQRAERLLEMYTIHLHRKTRGVNVISTYFARNGFSKSPIEIYIFKRT